MVNTSVLKETVKVNLSRTNFSLWKMQFKFLFFIFLQQVRGHQVKNESANVYEAILDVFRRRYAFHLLMILLNSIGSHSLL